MIPLRSILGLGPIPSHRSTASDWCGRQGVSTHALPVRGGEAEHVNLSDLPDDVRLTWWEREFERLRLEPGARDDDAHAEFMGASAKARGRAELKAAMAAMLTALKSEGLTESERFALVRERFGSKGTSRASLKRLQRQVQGIDPINYAPALLDDYKATVKRAEFSEEAWRFFMTMIRDAAPDWPLKEAWRRVLDAGHVQGWAVPSYPTFYRRWCALSEVQRRQARLRQHGDGQGACHASFAGQDDCAAAGPCLA